MTRSSTIQTFKNKHGIVKTNKERSEDPTRWTSRRVYKISAVEEARKPILIDRQGQRGMDSDLEVIPAMGITSNKQIRSAGINLFCFLILMRKSNRINQIKKLKKIYLLFCWFLALWVRRRDAPGAVDLERNAPFLFLFFFFFFFFFFLSFWLIRLFLPVSQSSGSSGAPNDRGLAYS